MSHGFWILVPPPGFEPWQLKGRAAGQGCGKEMDVQLADWGSDKDGLIRDLLGLKQQNKSQVEQRVLVKVGM